MDGRKGVLVALGVFAVVSVTLFFVARSYRRSNIPVWRVQLPRYGRAHFSVDMVAFIPKTAQFLVWDERGPVSKFDTSGRFKKVDSVVELGQSLDGVVYLKKQYKGQIYQWDVTKGDQLHPEWLSKPTLEFTQESHYFAERDWNINWPTLQIVGTDARGPVYLWSVNASRPTVTLPAPTLSSWDEVPYDVALSDDGRWCAVTYGLIKMEHGWPREVSKLYPRSSPAPEPPDFSQGGAQLVLFDLKLKTHRIINPDSNKGMQSPPHRRVYDNSLKFSPTSRYLVEDEYGSLNLWDVLSGHLLKIKKPTRLVSGSLGGATRFISFTPNESLIAVGGQEGDIEIFSAPTGQHLQTFNCTNKVTVLSFSPDGKRLIAGCEDGLVYCWDVGGL